MHFANFEFDPAEDRLGEGPQSEVYKARDTRLGRTVALKILRPHVEFDPQAKERFEREAKHTSNLAHPNIATVYEYGQDRGTSFIVMEYLEGRTLDRMLKARLLGYEEGIRIALQVTSALSLVHQRGLIHRDLKPANIMVQGDGTVKLLDFGICRSTGESNITQDGMLVGTVLYMAPEQILGEELDVRTDVFALGSVFYHAFTGELPFPGRSFPEVGMAILDAKPRRPSELRSGFPPPLEALLLRALSREREARFPNAAAAHGALLSVADSLRVSTSQVPSTVQGKLLLPPLDLDGGSADEAHARQFALGLRSDLRSELERSTQVKVTLSPDLEEARAVRDAFVLRGSLALGGDEAILDWVLEHTPTNGRDGLRYLHGEQLRHADSDEWGLQAKLVVALARSVKRKLAEFAVAPSPAGRDPERAKRLAKRAHAILHRGTTRHLMTGIASFRAAIEADPICALAHAGLSEALVRKFLDWDGDRGFLRESFDSARHALSLDPGCAEAHTSMGFGRLVTGELAEAQRELRLAIQLDHDEWLAHRLLGALLGRLGNYEGASPLLQRAIVLAPTHIGSYDHLYCVLSRLDRYQEAIEVADRGIAAAKRHLEDVPDDQEARLHLALLQARMGLHEDATAELERARQRAPKDAYTGFHAAVAYAVLGAADQAMRMLEEARQRGWFLESELLRNSDFDALRGRPDFQALLR